MKTRNQIGLLAACLLFLSTVWGQEAPEGFNKSPFQPQNGVQLIAYIELESGPIGQRVWWAAKNLTNNKLQIKFVKVTNTTCGTTIREDAETELAPGATVAASSFSGELTFETQVTKDICNNPKNRIKSVGYEKLVIKNISDQSGKTEETYAPIKTPTNNGSSGNSAKPINAPPKKTTPEKPLVDPEVAAFEAERKKDSQILATTEDLEQIIISDATTDSIYAIGYQRDYKKGVKSTITLTTHVLYRKADGYFPFTEDVRLDRESDVTQEKAYQFIGFISTFNELKNAISQIEKQAKQLGIPVKKNSRINKLNTYSRKKLTGEDFWNEVYLDL